MVETPHNIDDEARLQAATDWLLSIEENQADLAAFENWRQEPLNALAFLRVSRSAQAVGDLQHFQHPIGLGPGSHGRTANRRKLLFAGGAAVAASAAAGIIYFHPLRASAETKIGDFSTVQLPNGSYVDLNTNSKVSWEFSKSERNIWLDKGEVSLNISQDPRSCVLHCLGQKVLLSAGKFNARIKVDNFVLLPVKGVCSFMPVSRSQKVLALRPGERVVLGSAAFHVEPVSTEQASAMTAWEQRGIAASGMTMGELVDEVNRYRIDPIEIENPTLARTRIMLTGTWRIDSIEAQNELLDSIAASFNAHIERREDGRVIIT